MNWTTIVLFAASAFVALITILYFFEEIHISIFNIFIIHIKKRKKRKIIKVDVKRISHKKVDNKERIKQNSGN